MSQSNELRYTVRSITPLANRNDTSKSPTPTRRSPSRSPPPKRSASRSPCTRSPKRHNTSRSPPARRRGRSRSRDRSQSRSQDDRNPGNNLYVTGLSTRVTEDELERFFSKEGKMASLKRIRNHTPFNDLTNTTNNALNITTIGGSIQSSVQPPIVDPRERKRLKEMERYAHKKDKILKRLCEAR